MTTWYVHSNITGNDDGGLTGYDVSTGSLGSDSNNGTSTSTPFLTLTHLQSVIQTGDTAYLAGRFYTPDGTLTAFSVTNKNNITIAQWEGQAQAMIRGDNKISGDWTDNGDGTFSKTISTGLSLVAVTAFWDDFSQLQDNRRWGHLRLVANNAATAGETSTYYYTSGTGELRVHLIFGAEPNSSTSAISYSVANRRGLTFLISAVDGSNTPNIHISGLHFALFCHGSGAATPQGCGIYIRSGNGCIIEDCTFWDGGLHNISFGDNVRNNTCRNNIHSGMASGAVSIVFNATGSTTGYGAHYAFGCVAENETFYAHSLLDNEGARIVTGSTSIQCIYVHGTHTDVEVLNCQTIGYTPLSGTPDGVVPYSDADATSVSDANDPETYPFRVRQTDPDIVAIDNVAFHTNLGVASGMAYINAVMRFPYFYLNSNGYCFDFGTCTGHAGFFGCDLITDMSSTSRPLAVFGVGTSILLTLFNTSVLDKSSTVSSGSAASHAMFGFPADSASQGSIYARKCIFSFRATAAAGNAERRFISGDGDDDAGGADVVVPDANLDIKDCLVYNVTATKYSAVSTSSTGYNARNTSALWFSVIDLNGFELSMQPFADASGTLQLDLRTFGNAWDARKTAVSWVASDVRDNSNDGGYGCYFYGRDGALNTTDGLLNVNSSQIAGVVAPTPVNYIPRVGFVRTASTDNYVVIWYRSGALTAGAGSPISGTPTIEIFDSDGESVVASANLSQADDDVWVLTTTDKISAGTIAYAMIRATIDGSVRTFKEPVGRDRSST